MTNMMTSMIPNPDNILLGFIIAFCMRLEYFLFPVTNQWFIYRNRMCFFFFYNNRRGADFLRAFPGGAGFAVLEDDMSTDTTMVTVNCR